MKKEDYAVSAAHSWTEKKVGDISNIFIWKRCLRAPVVYTAACATTNATCVCVCVRAPSVVVASRTGRAARSGDIEVPFIGITFVVLE